MHTVPLFSFVRAAPPTATGATPPTTATAAADADATDNADAAADAEAEGPAYRVPHWILICFTDPTPAPPLLPCRVAAAPPRDADCDDGDIWLRPLNVPPLHMAERSLELTWLLAMVCGFVAAGTLVSKTTLGPADVSTPPCPRGDRQKATPACRTPLRTLTQRPRQRHA